jgi:hypothetical protein
MTKRVNEPFTFQEDHFDLDKHKKAARAYVRLTHRKQRARRRISTIKFTIMLLAFLMGFLLYVAINTMIWRYDYNKYHSSEVAYFID